LEVYHTYIALCRLSSSSSFFPFLFFLLILVIFKTCSETLLSHGDCVRNIHQKCYRGAYFSVLVEHLM
jgi:hypothetical protein